MAWPSCELSSMDKNIPTSRRDCELRFTNRTQADVRLFWITHKGNFFSYGIIEPGESFDMHSYEGHPWIAYAMDNYMPLKLNFQLVYFTGMPTAVTNEKQAKKEGNEEDARQVVNITRPVYPLKEYSKVRILELIRECEDAKKLLIPITLHDELLNFFDLQRDALRNFISTILTDDDDIEVEPPYKTFVS